MRKLREDAPAEIDVLAIENAILWAGLYLGDEHIDDALEVSAKLHVRAGWAAWAAGGRGAALVRSGRPSEGLGLLSSALERATDIASRAELHCWIAIAHAALRNVRQASEHHRAAIELDASSHALVILEHQGVPDLVERGPGGLDTD